jgi:hypothetical protein
MLRRFLTFLLPVLLLVGAPMVRAGAEPGTRAERFDSYLWWQRWGLPRSPWNAGVVPDGSGGGFLRVRIPKGGHDGTSFLLDTGDADEARVSYRIRVDSAFDPSRSSFDVKLPGFGKPVFDPLGGCLVGCGGARADGVTGWSARSDVHATGQPGFYVYDLDAGHYGRGPRWYLPRITPGTWHTVELHVRMNSVGQADGVLAASYDGTVVYRASNVRMRTSPTLHVGGAWFDVYYGGSGTSPATTYVDIDDIVLQIF